MKNRLLASLPLLCVLLCVFALGASAATTIVNDQQFASIANDLDGDYVLGADITVNASIGTLSNPFTGTLNGNGYTVTINVSKSSRAALIAYAGDGAVIENLTVKGVARDIDITDSYNCPAAFVGEAKGDITFTNCTSDATVAGNKYVGGFVGYVGTGTVTFNNCTNNSVVSGDGHLGGFVGYVSAGAVTFTDCTNIGTVSGNKYVGGFVGQATGGTVSIINSTNNGIVIGNGTEGCVGGFVGSVETTSADSTYTFDGCINKKDVTGKQMVGGIVGRFNIDSENTKAHAIKNCANYGAIKSISVALDNGMVGGIVGILSNGDTDGATSTITVDNCYNKGNITSESARKAYVGGIVGYFRAYAADKLALSNCMNSGAIEATNGTDCGGIIGYGNGGSTDYSFSNCYNCGSVKTYDGTRVGAIAACHGATAISSGKISGTYYLDIGESYATVNANSAKSQIKVTTANYGDASTFEGFSADYWTFESDGPMLSSFSAENVAETSTATVVVSAASAEAKDGVATVTVSVKATTPIVAAHFSVNAPVGFTLTSATSNLGEAAETATGFALICQDETTLPYESMLLNMSVADATVDAVVLTLTFAVADTVESGIYAVTVKAIDAYNLAKESIETASVSSEVTVAVLIGDVDDDGSITVIDGLTVLRALINGSDIAKCDMNGDRVINLIDVIRIFKLCVQ